jgi:hypothetical protein
LDKEVYSLDDYVMAGNGMNEWLRERPSRDQSVPEHAAMPSPDAILQLSKRFRISEDTIWALVILLGAALPIGVGTVASLVPYQRPPKVEQEHVDYKPPKPPNSTGQPPPQEPPSQTRDGPESQNRKKADFGMLFAN